MKRTRRLTPFNVYKMPTYVINMKERNDRWSRFISQPATKTMKMKRIQAVNGKKLDYKKDPRISMHTKLNILQNYRRAHYEIATLGAVGASLSHISIWKRFVASGAPYCLIFEDDAIITESQMDDINEIAKSLPSDWGMWILGRYKPNTIYEPLSTKPWNRIYKYTAAHAYILKRSTALTLLEEPLPIETHIEYYITGSSIIKEFKIVEHPDIFIEFFRAKSGPRTSDSNTSQHKKNGCPSCSFPEDYSQLYEKYRRTRKNGLEVHSFLHRQQSNEIRKLE
jgi:hypothetical protein